MWEVKTENISFDSTCPGQKTAGYFFVSPQLERPKALVQLCHGMCEHLGRYEDFAAFLVRHGYGVFGTTTWATEEPATWAERTAFSPRKTAGTLC